MQLGHAHGAESSAALIAQTAQAERAVVLVLWHSVLKVWLPCSYRKGLAAASALCWNPRMESRTKLQFAIRLALAALCLLGAGWTCTAMMRPRQVATMTQEQCLELVRQGKASPAVANALRSHALDAVEALRQCGPDGDNHLQRIREAIR